MYVEREGHKLILTKLKKFLNSRTLEFIKFPLHTGPLPSVKKGRKIE